MPSLTRSVTAGSSNDARVASLPLLMLLGRYSTTVHENHYFAWRSLSRDMRDPADNPECPKGGPDSLVLIVLRR